MFSIQWMSCCQLLLPDDNNMKLRATINIAGCGTKAIPAVSMKFQWHGERGRGETRWAAGQQQALLLNSKLELDILLKPSASSRNLSGTNRRFTQIISQATSLCKWNQLHSSQRSKAHLSQLRICKFFCQKETSTQQHNKSQLFSNIQNLKASFSPKIKTFLLSGH